MNTHFSMSRLWHAVPRSFGIALVASAALAGATIGFCGEIHLAAYRGNVARVRALLKHHPELVSSKDRFGATPLSVAAWHGQKNVVEFLLAHGADVDATDEGRETPLFRAASGGYTDLAKLLLAHGAEANAKDHSGKTPLHVAAENGHKEVAALLLANKAEINADDDTQETPLDMAAEKGPIDLVELLLANGAMLISAAIGGPSTLLRLRAITTSKNCFWLTMPTLTSRTRTAGRLCT